MLRFGTDGIRGDAEIDLSSALVRAVGRAAARVLGTDTPFVVGRDTRLSGPRIEADLVAGLEQEGASAHSVGVLPTPGIAYLANVYDAPGAVISASHNPFSDNGVKLFTRGGWKLSDATEGRVEAELGRILDDDAPRVEVPRRDAPRGTYVATPAAAPAPPSGGAGEYLAHLVGALEGRRLDGLLVVLDAANGAACEIGPAALRAVGAEVLVVNADPDGANINDHCGSTHPEGLQAAVLESGAAAGLALDGDADRVLAVDENGALIDGDQIMAVAALDLRERGRLRNGAVALTVMSNLGLRRALADAGIGVVETAVGDRNVLDAMREHGLSLGGEQSGHVIFGDLASTGDGILTGMFVLDRMARAGRPLSELAASMTRLPQVLGSVRVVGRPEVAAHPRIGAAIERVAQSVGARGRVLVRASGTEPVVRVMVEAPTQAEAAEAVAQIRAVIEAELGES